MKAHIVVTEHKSDWIIARMACHLAKRHRWSISNKPREDRDVNIFLPYLDWRFSHWRSTKTIAFFTHAERSNSMKMKWWKHVPPRVHLCVTMAERYADEMRKLGAQRVLNITPPVEAMFRWRPLATHAKPRIGVAGKVYRGGRKGEKLVARLHRDNAKRWDVVATGKGWPIPSKHRAWKLMPAYYQDLDVFLCTSLEEGGPVTLLEALASGRPIVAPRGVGIVDELPSVRGIWKYAVGDYGSMMGALEKAVRNPCNPERLHNLVADRTVERYCDEWLQAVQELYGGELLVPAAPAPKPAEEPWQDKCGVYIVAFDQKAHDCAYHLIRTIHKYSPGIPIALVCEGFKGNFAKPADPKLKPYATPLPETFKRVLRPGDVVIPYAAKDRRARSPKTKVYTLAPAEWQYVLYLDADILVRCKLDPIFQMLHDGWDAVFTLSVPDDPLVKGCQRAKYKAENKYTNGKLGSNEILQWAGGVWAFQRNERTRRWLTLFHEEWKRYSHTDQQAMMRSLWRSGVRAWTLGTEWNTFAHKGELNRSAGIYHFATAARGWGGIKHDGRKLWRKWSGKLK